MATLRSEIYGGSFLAAIVTLLRNKNAIAGNLAQQKIATEPKPDGAVARDADLLPRLPAEILTSSRKQRGPLQDKEAH